MKKVIQYMPAILIKNLFMFLVILAGCQNNELKSLPKVVSLETPRGEILKTSMAYSAEEQAQGLSGVADTDFRDDQAMLFFNMTSEVRHFWMPDTYFNLDIFFLDENLKIIDVDRNVQHYIGRENPETIPRAKPVFCRHILELKAKSQLSINLKIGETLLLKEVSLQQIQQGIHLGL